MANLYYLAKWSAQEPGYAARRLWQQAQGLVSRKHRFPLKDIVLFFTFNCDLRCVMCPLWGAAAPLSEYEPSLSGRTVPPETIFALVDDAAPYLPTFLFSGGEPLLYRPWKAIARYVRQKGLHCNLQTNGSLLAAHASEVAQLFDFVNVSVDGLTTHDDIRGRRGSFAQIQRGLEALHQAKRGAGRERPYLNICVTVGPENAWEMEDLCDFFHRAPYRIASLIYMQREFNEAPPYREAEKEELVALFSRLRRRRGEVPFELIFRPDVGEEGMRGYLRAPQQFLKKTFRNCPYPYYEIFVHPDGSVWTCPSTEIGNLRQERFRDIWRRVREGVAIQPLLASLSLCKRCKGEVYMYTVGSQRMRGEAERAGQAETCRA